MYANEHGGLLPPINDYKNNFIFNGKSVFPEWITDPSILICTHDTNHDREKVFRLSSTEHHPGNSIGEAHPDCITDLDYCYLGWDVRTDEQAIAFFQIYDRLSPADYGKDIITTGVEVLFRALRLQEDATKNVVTKENEKPSHESVDPSSLIPVVWDRPYVDYRKLNNQHDRKWGPGGFVLYLDGHIEYVRFGERFPMTETMARLLDERPRMPIPDCE